MEDRRQMVLDAAKGLRAFADTLEMAVGFLREKGIDGFVPCEDIQPGLFDDQTSEAVLEEKKAEKPPLSLTDVRKILAEKSRDGYTEQVRLLLEKYGADKLSAIDASHYRNLADDALCLGATLADLQSAIEAKTNDGFADQIKAVFAHHFATNLEDLKPSSYAGFLRDIRRLGDE